RTASTFSFIVTEGVAAHDLNGDGDQGDSVVTLRNRTTGIEQPIGANASCGVAAGQDAHGRAVVRDRMPPFSFPDVATEGNVVAFLESEPNENQCDANGDGDQIDSILRVFRLGPTEVTQGLDVAATPSFAVNGRSLAVSNGRVFFRAPEWGNAPRTTEWASVSSAEVGGNDFSSVLDTQ